MGRMEGVAILAAQSPHDLFLDGDFSVLVEDVVWRSCRDTSAIWLDVSCVHVAGHLDHSDP